MSVSKKEYNEMSKKVSPPSPFLKNILGAFFIGGAICCFGEVLYNLYLKAGLTIDEVKALVPMTLIVITAILTGIGVFDKIARYAGAGTIVPITGFANSVVSPAMEFKHEGRILGTGAQIFSIAGPVILYGATAATVYGLIFWIVKAVM